MWKLHMTNEATQRIETRCFGSVTAAVRRIIEIEDSPASGFHPEMHGAVMNLRRIDPERNMRRFYRLDVQPDLFGGVLLMKQWGRIGARGRVTAERYDTPALAIAALQRQADRKRRRGYQAAFTETL
jgi:predicted DNA-binding WGR domain protein